MTLDEIFHLWAPAEGRWSPWVKPVLFSWMARPASGSPIAVDLSDWHLEWLDPQAKDVALVIDVPGPEAVALGISMATRGFRPVPLFNALPSPNSPAAPRDSSRGAPELVDVFSIVHALRQASTALAALPLAPDAAPAFLLDSRRRTSSRPIVSTHTYTYFDNRSLSFPTDFPSANFLLAQGLRRVVVLQRGSVTPESDLAHTLRPWADAGLRVEVLLAGATSPPQLCAVPKPNFWQRLYHRLLEVFGFHRNVLGGFGGTLGGESAG